jgi:hypothetical protein
MAKGSRGFLLPQFYLRFPAAANFFGYTGGHTQFLGFCHAQARGTQERSRLSKRQTRGLRLPNSDGGGLSLQVYPDESAGSFVIGVRRVAEITSASAPIRTSAAKKPASLRLPRVGICATESTLRRPSMPNVQQLATRPKAISRLSLKPGPHIKTRMGRRNLPQGGVRYRDVFNARA